MVENLEKSLENNFTDLSVKATDRLGENPNERLRDAFKILLEKGDTRQKTPSRKKRVKRCDDPNKITSISSSSLLEKWLSK